MYSINVSSGGIIWLEEAIVGASLLSSGVDGASKLPEGQVAVVAGCSEQGGGCCSLASSASSLKLDLRSSRYGIGLLVCGIGGDVSWRGIIAQV